MAPHRAAARTVAARPAETAGVGATAVGLAVAIVDRNWLAAGTAAAGLVAALITGWRVVGGARGLRSFVLTGRGG